MSELQYLLNWMYVFIVCLIGMTIGALGSIRELLYVCRD